MTSEKSSQTGNINAGIRDVLFYCVPSALILLFLSYLQLSVISDLSFTFTLVLLPVLLGTAIGIFLIYIKSQGRLLSRKIVLDPLTGTLNRSWFQSTRNEILDNCLSEGKPLSIVFFDIDHFQQINETNGYQAGDEIIRKTAQIVTRSLRRSDWIIRWGGEEFIILLSETPSSSAMTVAERLRKVIASYNFPGNMMITCSFGIAEFNPDTDNSLEEVVNRAEAALYYAKEAGRNCVQDADEKLVASAENPVLDHQVVRNNNEVPALNTLSILRHARELLAPEYVKRLMRESVIALLIVFPPLALIKSRFLDGINIGFEHLIIPAVIALVIGILIGNFRILGKAIETQDYRDSLTQAYNRHWIEGFGRQQVQQSYRYGSPLSLALLKIDNLKEINRAAGTSSGDKVIKNVAAAIRETADESSSLIRWTGQIFLLFMPGIESEQALEYATKILEKISASKVDRVENIQCSIGLTCFISNKDIELQDLLKRADMALAQASSEKNNSIKVA